MTWRDFDEPLWDKLWAEAENSELPELKQVVAGCDRDSDMLTQARTNAQQAGISGKIQFAQTELSQLEAPADRGVLICNPPYGESAWEMLAN
jgi:putative N6-adenine-specific DNA methylase